MRLRRTDIRNRRAHNASLLRRFLAGDAEGAAADLNGYLTDSERMLQAIVDSRTAGGGAVAGAADTVSP